MGLLTLSVVIYLINPPDNLFIRQGVLIPISLSIDLVAVYILFSVPSIKAETDKERWALQVWLSANDYVPCTGIVMVTSTISKITDIVTGSRNMRKRKEISFHLANGVVSTFSLSVVTNYFDNYLFWYFDDLKYLLIRRKDERGYGRSYYKK